MWEVESINSMTGGVYVIHHTETEGYLSDNGTGGGALHFDVKEEAEMIAELLNSVDVH